MTAFGYEKREAICFKGLSNLVDERNPWLGLASFTAFSLARESYSRAAAWNAERKLRWLVPSALARYSWAFRKQKFSSRMSVATDMQVSEAYLSPIAND